MDSTFMTIHNLSSDANILFASDSILDILGYQPRDVEGRSCFDYFHPEEVPLARYVHGRGVLMDRAAALHYTRIRNVHGQWIGCECTFSVVHDILVACTSIYHQDEKSQSKFVCS
jgi:PAS domain S-box-containing protein